MEEYQSAIMSFESLIDNYYDTEVLEKGHVGIIRCYSLMDELNKAESYYNDHSAKILRHGLKHTSLYKYIEEVACCLEFYVLDFPHDFFNRFPHQVGN